MSLPRTIIKLIIIKLLINSDVLNSKPLDTPNLILISFDGFRWDYLENHTLPNFHKYFLKDGVKVSKGLKNAFSTVTFPNHWTLATGLYPESHGIVSNVMYDSKLNQTYYDFGPLDNDTNWFGQNKNTIPIWILNQLKDSRKSGIVGGFPGANVPFLNKSVSFSLDYKNELDWLAKVDNLLDMFTSGINFGVLYFPEPDECGHTYGPYSNEIKDILIKCDTLIGYLVDKLKQVGIYEQMNIIVTSDHGMDKASFENSIDLSDYVDITKFKSYGGLTQINIFPNDPKDTDLIYNALKDIPNYNIYKREQVPKRLNYMNNVRIGPLVMFGDVGYETFRTNRKKFDWENWKGDHGGDNEINSMHPVFVARGPSFKKGFSLNTVMHSVDVYPLMCFILNLEPAENNGSFENFRGLIDQSEVSVVKLSFDSITNYFHVLFIFFIIVSVIIYYQLNSKHRQFLVLVAPLSPNLVTSNHRYNFNFNKK